MNSHLTPEELITALDGGLPPAEREHLDRCARCRETLHQLGTTLAIVERADDVPEPSPLFWSHLSARVRESIRDGGPRVVEPWWVSAWKPLAAALNGLHDTGRDVIIDAGRLGLSGSPEPLIYAADLMLLVVRSDLVALAAARSWAETLRAGSDELGAPARVQALLVGEGRPYRGRDVAKVLGLPVVAALAWQEAEAAVFSRGAAPPRRFDGRALPRSLRAARAAIESTIAADADQLASPRMRRS